MTAEYATSPATPPSSRLADTARAPLVQQLTTQLLNAYERSAVYRQPGKWRRSVLLRCDVAVPEAFTRDGAAAMESLEHAARALEEAGAARVEWTNGWAANVPHRLRMGADQLPAAEALGRSFGYEFLTDRLEDMAQLARKFVTDVRINPTASPWLARFLEDAVDRLEAADTAIFDVSRERFKQYWTELCDALRAAVAIAMGQEGWERTVSQRVFADTKRLALIRSRVSNLLVKGDPRWTVETPGDPISVLAAYGVRRQPPSIVLAGAGEIRFDGSLLRLEDMVPYATLPIAWSAAVAHAFQSAPPAVITTIENLYAFLTYIEEVGGVTGLARRGEVALYTAGHLTRPVVEVLRVVRQARHDCQIRHWGDADVGGLEIWRALRRALGGPVPMFRMSSAAIRQSVHLGTRLTSTERASLTRFRALLLEEQGDAKKGAAHETTPPSDGLPNSDLQSAIDLIDTMLDLGLKVEQEACDGASSEGTTEVGA